MLRALCITLLVVVLAAAQLPEDSQVITVDVDLVNIYFTVSNKRGRLITNLDRANFTAFEDEQPQIVTHFSRETDVPVTMVLLIDSSGSVRDKLRVEKEAATQFLEAMLRPGQDKAALYTFDDVFELHQDFTDAPALLSRALGKIIAGGGTRLYDALYFVIAAKLTVPDQRKIIVLITDGDDKSSRHSPQDVIDLAQRNNVSIYSISVNALGLLRSDSSQIDGILGMLSSETGGMAFFPQKRAKLASDFGKIREELRSQYTIAYRSTNQRRDGTFRKIRIDARKDYSVRTRSGYYAPASATAGGYRNQN